MLFRLRPGAHLLRRRDDRWQVGLDPSRRVLLPVGTGAPPHRTPPAAADLPPQVVFGAALPAPDSCRDSVRRTVAALAREAGDECGQVLERRSQHVVHVVTFGCAAGVGVADELVAVCERSGLRLSASRPVSAGVNARRRPATVVALVGVGEPSREELDHHARDQTPHLLLRLVEGRVVLGPFVLPGRTPCLRCLDAHLTDGDPSWPLLVEQYARAARTERADGVPEPVDAALASLAVAWAARDLATYAEGGTPTTLASTIELAPRLETVESRRWSPHGRCGCSWR